MSSIDTVSASFVTSLALVDGGKAPDLGKIRGVRVYDGITPMADFPMRYVRMWVIISLIPPQYKEPYNLRFISNLLGEYLDYDCIEFRKGVMKILFTHDIYKPVLLERQIHLDPGVEPMLNFNFLHLLGTCFVYNMTTRPREKCDGTHTVLGTS
ncbi:hypothetical protein ACLB2K_025193 [Fragaria x ananassa]